jgi:CelD/BcsL family acetyltransferase involved in cellulose biosynthesis
MSIVERAPAKVTVQAQEGGIEAVERLAPEWRSLCLESPDTAPFYRPEWITAYLRAFHPPGDPLLVTAYTGDRLSGVLPLLEQDSFFCGFPVRKLRGAANVHSYRFDLVRRAGPDCDSAVAAMWELLRDRGGWDLLELPDVPQGGAGELLLQVAQKDGFLIGRGESLQTPYISLTGIKDGIYAPRNSHFRQNLRRRLSKAQKQYGVCLRRIDIADSKALEQFYELERKGWKGRKGTAIACAGATRAFYDEIAGAAARFQYFSLYLLEFGDQVVAGHYGLTYDGHYYSAKVAYDETYAAYGPGHLIVDAILRDCLQRGLREFDFLGPSMEWKSEWTQETRRHANCYIFRQGLFGQMLYLTNIKLRTRLRNLRAAIGRSRSS